MIRGREAAAGYTIVETLIFLAVSALMFVAAVAAISGRQNKAMFVNAVRDFETQIIDVANDVANGYYQVPGGISCTAGVVAEDSTGTRGANKDCILIGRTLVFTDRDSAAIHTMYGNRDDEGSINTVNPRLLLNAATPVGLLNGMTVSCVALADSCTAGSDSNGAIGIFMQPNNGIESLNGNDGSGIKTDAYLYGNAKIGETANLTDVLNFSQATKVDQTVTVCLASGTTSQYALVQLKATQSSGLSVTSTIREGGSCS